MRRLAIGIGIIAGLMGLVIALNRQQVERALFIAGLDDAAPQTGNFGRVSSLFPVKDIPASAHPRGFPEAAHIALPPTFGFAGQQINAQDFLDRTATTSLFILQNGQIKYEVYQGAGAKYLPWLSMDLAHLYIVTLLEMAIDRGEIAADAAALSAYMPRLADTAYADVKIAALLQRQKGRSLPADAALFGRYLMCDKPLTSLMDEMATGASHRAANSSDPIGIADPERGHFKKDMAHLDMQILSYILRTATGRSVAAYLSDELMQPLGAEYPAYWALDSQGDEIAPFGLNATARDYAKLGELLRLDGVWQGERILPPRAVPQFHRGEFWVMGAGNQALYVNRATGIVIVKLGADGGITMDADRTANRAKQALTLFRAVSDSL